MPEEKRKKPERSESEDSLDRIQLRIMAAGTMIGHRGNVEAAKEILNTHKSFRKLTNHTHFMETWYERTLGGAHAFSNKRRAGGHTRFPEISDEQIAEWFLERMEINGVTRHFYSIKEVRASRTLSPVQGCPPPPRAWSCSNPQPRSLIYCF